MIPQSAIQTAESPPESPSKTSRKTGCAPYAESARKTSVLWNKTARAGVARPYLTSRRRAMESSLMPLGRVTVVTPSFVTVRSFFPVLSSTAFPFGALPVHEMV